MVMFKGFDYLSWKLVANNIGQSIVNCIFFYRKKNCLMVELILSKTGHKKDV